jgi:hypothetical protein
MGVLGNLLQVLARDGETYGAEYQLAAAKFLAFLCGATRSTDINETQGGSTGGD